jgi:hypothetical protein
MYVNFMHRKEIYYKKLYVSSIVPVGGLRLPKVLKNMI